MEVCTSADFSCANALLTAEFAVFVEQMACGSNATDGAKLRDFRRTLAILTERNRTIRWATGGKRLKNWNGTQLGHGESCHIVALSPSDKEYSLFLEEVAIQSPRPREPFRASTTRTPNLTSVVLQIEFESTAILLGADLESHHDPQRGWTAAVHEGKNLSVRRASILKVPHHGSATGHHESIWSRLMESKPIATLTPFNRLPRHRQLPTDEDVDRIRSLTSSSYSTARRGVSRTLSRSAAVERSLRESSITIRSMRQELGATRFRRRPSSDWSVELFGPARELRRVGE